MKARQLILCKITVTTRVEATKSQDPDVRMDKRCQMQGYGVRIMERTEPAKESDILYNQFG